MSGTPDHATPAGLVDRARKLVRAKDGVLTRELLRRPAASGSARCPSGSSPTP